MNTFYFPVPHVSTATCCGWPFSTLYRPGPQQEVSRRPENGISFVEPVYASLFPLACLLLVPSFLNNYQVNVRRAKSPCLLLIILLKESPNNCFHNSIVVKWYSITTPIWSKSVLNPIWFLTNWHEYIYPLNNDGQFQLVMTTCADHESKFSDKF